MINVTQQKKEDLIKIIEERHSSDAAQLDFIKSNDDRIILCAKAGCGKTLSMTSKIIYEIIMGNIPANKKVLALTFSINAGVKMKDDIEDILSQHFNYDDTRLISSNITVANYHKLALHMLSKYGSYVCEGLNDIKDFTICADKEIESLLSKEEQLVINDLNESIRGANGYDFEKKVKRYNQVMIEKVIPNKVITYNSQLSLIYGLFNLERIGDNFKKEFQERYSLVIVDEFQDTNLLAMLFLRCFINKPENKGKIILMGDSLQRIYGFMGAIPDLMEINGVVEKYKKYEFIKSYRYDGKSNLNDIDEFYRELKKVPGVGTLQNSITLNVCYCDKEDESLKVVDIIKSLDNFENLAILVKAAWNAEKIMEKLDNNNIGYFNALFSESADKYTSFHRKVLIEFERDFSNPAQCIPSKFKLFVNKIETIYDGKEGYDSLIILLTKLLENTKGNSYKEIKTHILNVLEGDGLRRYMQFVDEKICITTIHQSKGLEWDYVLLPSISKRIFPHKTVCEMCAERKSNINERCDYKSVDFSDPSFRQKFLDDVSVFYVGLTRAKKDVFITSYYSRGYNGDFYDKMSCFITHPNISHNIIK